MGSPRNAPRSRVSRTDGSSGKDVPRKPAAIGAARSTPRSRVSGHDDASSGKEAAAKLELGQVGFLEVTDVSRFGAWVDWGMPQQLLVPLGNQVSEMKKGQCYAIGLVRDEAGRLVGTQRIAEMLREPPPFKVDDWVDGQAWRREPKLGVFVIVEKRYLGLVSEAEPHDLQRAQTAHFRVSQVLPDGKIQLSLRRKAFEELQDDAQRVLQRLKTAYFRVSDDTDPAIIREQFALSKKAYKRAVGRLLKQGLVELDAQGYVLLPKEREPANAAAPANAPESFPSGRQ
jgi:uncharacterized protein